MKVSKITDAMKGNLEGDDEELKLKYITAMNISWEKQNSRELYLSMLKEFIFSCTEDDIRNKVPVFNVAMFRGVKAGL